MNWRTATASAAAILAIAPFASAFGNDDDSQKKVQDLTEKVEALIKSNEELRKQVETLQQSTSRGPSNDDLDRAIADLSSRLDQAGTAKAMGTNVTAPNVRALKISFENRFRFSQYFNPAFGAQKNTGPVTNNNAAVVPNAAPGPINGSELPSDYLMALNRLRIELDVDINDKLGAFIQLQASRAWGGATPNNTNAFGSVLPNQAFTPQTAAVPNDFADRGVHQAYMVLKDVFDSSGNLTLGRQVFNLGNERLLSGADWDNTGRSFDGVRFDYSTDEISFTAMAANVVQGGLDFHNADTWLYGAWLVVHPTSEIAITPYTLYVNNGNPSLPTAPTPVGNPWTVGVLADINVEAVKLGGELAVQQDEDRPNGTPAGVADQSEEQVSFGEAVAFEIHAEIAIPDADEFKPYIGGEFGQGNKFFNDLYSSRHGLYGLGDFVTSWTNLQYFKVYGGATVAKDIDVGAAFWWFHQTSNAGIGGTRLSKDVGEEFDLWANIRCSDHLTTMIGWSHFFTGSSFQDGAVTPGAWYATALTANGAGAGQRQDADVLFVQATFSF